MPDSSKKDSPKPWVYTYLEEAAARSLSSARVSCILMLISMGITIFTVMYFHAKATCH
jgi:hypothetical protein